MLYVKRCRGVASFLKRHWFITMIKSCYFLGQNVIKLSINDGDGSSQQVILRRDSHPNNHAGTGKDRTT